MMQVIHHHLPSVDSTHTWAKAHTHEFDADQLTLITADVQTAGRGQFHRQWLSPAHQNIYASFHFTYPLDRQDIYYAAQLLSITGAKLLASLKLKPRIKWPNDLLINHKKIAGALAETTTFNNHMSVICSIGLNVNMTEDQLRQVGQPATSILLESGDHYSLSGLTLQLQQQFLEDLSLFLKKGFDTFQPMLKDLLLES
jgi:BirA family transcriptional regulator, biotin operon repressor / biotin---[acetyl-CoA-carboxylase] ligase